MLSPLLLDLSMQWLLSSFLLKDNDNKATQSIIVLGRGPSSQAERALVASQLWKENQAAIVFVSGMTDAPPIIETLKEMGVPEEKIEGERCSQSTWENGLFSEILLNSQSHKHVLLVTDSPHMIRALLVFQNFGFDATPHAIQIEPEKLLSIRRSKLVLREYAALVAYSISGKLRDGSEAEQENNRAEAIYKVKDWGCQL
ncbi:MAG: YdcF family protein [Thainema sp.]